MKNTIENKVTRFNGTAPSLFLIPLDVFSDEMEKERDKESFLKLQQLRKNCDQLREKLNAFTERNFLRIEITKGLVIKSDDFKKRGTGRRFF